MFLYILFNTGVFECYHISRFSDLSETKSNYYYYETPVDESGKGTCILRSEISCFEVSPYRLPYLDKQIGKKNM